MNIKAPDGKENNKPATILRPGAETNVGGFPLTTIGFRPPLREEESDCFRGWEGGRGKELKDREAMNASPTSL